MFSKIVRRTHMYLALFLTPWILMYALSTMAMNHRHFFEEYYGDNKTPFHLESETTYSGIFPDNAKPNTIAQQILLDLNMDGTHYVRGGRNGKPITIWREAPLWTKRITYTPDNNNLRIERQESRMPTILEELHRRKGFEQDYLLADLWGIIVDLVIAAMVFWVLSGLWMWWELKMTRQWGGLFILAGALLFALFLATI